MLYSCTSIYRAVTWVHVHVCGRPCKLSCRGPPGPQVSFLRMSPPCILRESPTEMGLQGTAMLDILQAPRSDLPAPTFSALWLLVEIVPGFCMVLGTELKSLYLCSGHFIYWATPQLHHFLKLYFYGTWEIALHWNLLYFSSLCFLRFMEIWSQSAWSLALSRKPKTTSVMQRLYHIIMCVTMFIEWMSSIAYKTQGKSGQWDGSAIKGVCC